jgi:hypothetical protein
MTLKGEAPASVQCAALRSLSHVLSTIDTVPTSDAKIFNECACPFLALSHCPFLLASGSLTASHAFCKSGSAKEICIKVVKWAFCLQQ